MTRVTLRQKRNSELQTEVASALGVPPARVVVTTDGSEVSFVVQNPDGSEAAFSPAQRLLLEGINHRKVETG